MLLLTSTSDLVEVTTSGSTVIQVHASFVDQSSPTTFTPTRLNTSINSPTTTTVVTSPAGSTQRNVKYLSIQNTNASASNTITVIHTDAVTPVQIFKATLLAGWTASYNDLEGWFVVDAGGGRLVTPLAGRWLKSSVLSGGTSFTTGPSTNTLKLRGVAAGGGGGGVSNTAANGAAGGGGGGSYLEKTVTVTPNTVYAYTVGAAGTGVSGAAGNNGGNSTFVVGGVTYTCNGGTGGPLDTSTAGLQEKIGGAGGVVSTNGDLNSTGDNGQSGVVALTGGGLSGNGAGSQFGGGGLAIAASGTGNAGGGFGSGGSGGLSLTQAARTGGNGTGGCWIVDEYS